VFQEFAISSRVSSEAILNEKCHSNLCLNLNDPVPWVGEGKSGLNIKYTFIVKN
jgi:hypothetical protein